MSKKTPWFDGSVKPVRDGVYEQRAGGWNSHVTGFQYWDGRFWFAWARTPNGAVAHYNSGNLVAMSHQDDPWRGLARKP